MSLIEVLTEDGEQVAKIIEDNGKDGILIRYIAPYKTSDKLFKFEKNTYVIERDNVCGFYDTDDMSLLGYTQVGANLYEYDEGSDYVPSTDESDDDEDDCVDSEEEYMSDEC